MPYTACIQHLDTHLEISIRGTLATEEELADFVELLTRMSIDYNTTRGLLDGRFLKKELDVLAIYKMAESEPVAQAAIRGVRLACLPNPEQMDYSTTMETLLHNRSVEYRVFTDRDEAVAWLTR